jgi:adenosylmethionine-8-amino-7-oxononanoate aminotransferase
VFEEEQTLAHLPAKIERLASHLHRLAQMPHVGDVRQCGLIGAIELVQDRRTNEQYPWEQKRGIQVCQHAREEGVLLRPLGNVIVIMPPLVVRIEEIDRIMSAVERGIEKVSGEW